MLKIVQNKAILKGGLILENYENEKHKIKYHEHLFNEHFCSGR